MYLSNKYTKWYYNIIHRANNRTLTEYSEKHHIIPKSLGGSNDKENLAVLTAREHFICHWLLYKMTTGIDKSKMARAWFRMCQTNKFQIRYSSRSYDLARKAFSKNNPFRSQSVIEIVRKRMLNNNPMKNHETSQKVSDALKGKCVGIKNHFYGKKHTLETKIQMRAKAIGRTTSPETIQKRLDTIARKNTPRVLKVKTCPHCGIEGKGGNMSRYHFSNCQMLKLEPQPH